MDSVFSVSLIHVTNWDLLDRFECDTSYSWAHFAALVMESIVIRHPTRVKASTSTGMPSSLEAGVVTDIPVSLVVFRLCWWALQLFHLFNGLFLLFIGLVHVAISLPTIYARAWILRIPHHVFVASGWTFLVLAALNLGVACLHIKRSVSSGRLVFKYEPRKHHDAPSRGDVAHNKSSDFMKSRSWSTRVLSTTESAVNTVIQRPRNAIQRYFGLRGLFGLHGRLYDYGFYTRHVFELFCQAYQANQLSQSIARPALNRIIVVFTVANAMYAPVIDVILRSHPSWRRVMIVVVDITLEFGFSVGVTLSVMIPYALLFNWSTASFPDQHGYDDVWLANLLSELRQVLVSSNLDYVSSMFPHVVMLMGADVLVATLCRSGSSISEPASGTSMPTKLQVLSVKTVSPAPPQPLVISREVWHSYRASHPSEPRVVLLARQRRRWITVLRLFELSTVVFSILLLYCHFNAHAVASPSPSQAVAFVCTVGSPPTTRVP